MSRYNKKLFQADTQIQQNTISQVLFKYFIQEQEVVIQRGSFT